MFALQSLTKLAVDRLLGRVGLTSKMYAISVISIAMFAIMAAYVAYFTIQTRNTIQRIERDALGQAAITSEIEQLQNNQRGLILTFILSPHHTFADADLAKLKQSVGRLHQLSMQMSGAPIASEAEFDSLTELASDLTAAPDQATLRVFLKVLTSVDRQIHAAAQSRSGRLNTDLKKIASMGDELAWCVAVFAALLAGVIVPVMVMTVTRFTRRINSVTRMMHSIADCETSADVPSTIDVDEVGDLARAVQVFKRNTIALQRNSSEILRLNSWFDLALNNMHGGLSIFDQNCELVMCNERYLELYDLPKDLGRPGTSFRAILEYWKDTQVRGPDFDVETEVESYLATLAGQEEFVQLHALPKGRTVLISCRPSPDGGWVDVHEDVTDRVESDQTIERLAHCDLLTGLMNRQNFIKTLAARLADIGASPRLAVLLVDIPNFKRVNDVYGHESGDQVLKAMAARLASLAVTGDILARMQGDAFALVKVDADAATASALAARLCDIGAEAVEVDGQTIEFGISVGVAISPEHGETAGELLQRAELALTQSKSVTDRGYALFDADHENSVREHEALKNDLKIAFELGQLELHYQPIMDYKTRQIASVEALMRWRHPTRGSVSPSVFISIAEETGLINELGKWAIGRACRDALDWPSHVRVAVNLSANQFRQGDLHTIAHAALRESGLSPKRLEFEVTESLLLSDELRTRRTLNRLKAMGIRIALDDFGTGYASLSYLRSFPFDKIKIDQTFVRDLPRDADCNAIVRSVVLLARMLGMRTVAEGIETAEHLEQVVAAGCDEIQGYYLSRPVPAAGIPAIIADCESRLSEAA